MIIKEQHDDGTEFWYDGQHYWIKCAAWKKKAPTNAFRLIDEHIKCQAQLEKRVERYKKLEKLLS